MKGFLCCILIKSESSYSLKGTLELRPYSYIIISNKPSVRFTAVHITWLPFQICFILFLEHIQYFIQLENHQWGQRLYASTLITKFSHSVQVGCKTYLKGPIGHFWDHILRYIYCGFRYIYNWGNENTSNNLCLALLLCLYIIPWYRIWPNLKQHQRTLMLKI